MTSEVFRVYPPIEVTLRAAAEDTSLNGMIVPMDMSIVLSQFATSRRVALWGADSEFRPERWAGREDRRTAVESNYSFLSSLAGPRGCIKNVCQSGV